MISCENNRFLVSKKIKKHSLVKEGAFFISVFFVN